MSILEQYNELEQKLNKIGHTRNFDPTTHLKLERIECLLKRLDSPERKYKTIHVGGTAGKGSTSTLIANILEAHGYVVGLHTSPHLQIVNERHVVNGKSLSTSKLIKLFTQIEPHILWMERNHPQGAPTYFEVQIALSFLAFAYEDVDWAVIEVGLGGTYDATNVITPELAVLTNVGLDHTEILGDTVEEIARDKVGIIKKDIPVVTGAEQESVLDIISDKAHEMNSPLFILGKDFVTDDIAGASIPGEKHRENIAVSLQTAKLVLDSSFDHDKAHMAASNTTLPARIEQIQDSPLVIIDGAHNHAKIQASIKTIESLSQDKKIYTVLGLKQDKDSSSIISEITKLSSTVLCTQFLPKHTWEPLVCTQLANQISNSHPSITVTTEPDPLVAMRNLLSKVGPQDMIWVVGSLYLAGDIREIWFPKEKLLNDLE